MALTLHVAADFTFQSPETALRKAECHRHHWSMPWQPEVSPWPLLGTWMVAGVISHYVVDWTRKFGLRQVALAVALDQACHLLTILVLVLIC